MFVLRLLKFKELLPQSLNCCLLFYLQISYFLRSIDNSLHSKLGFLCCTILNFLVVLILLEHEECLEVIVELLVVLEALEDVVARREVLHRTVDFGFKRGRGGKGGLPILLKFLLHGFKPDAY
jgi:hypothetical protein